MKSRFFSVHALIGTILAAQKHKGVDDWTPVNGEQEWIKSTVYRPALADMRSGRVSEARHKAGSIGTVNEFLREEGFDIQLESGIWAAAGIISMLVEWARPGEVDVLEYGGKSYPAATIENKMVEVDGEKLMPFETHTIDGHKHPVLTLRTKDKTRRVCITRFDGEFETDRAVLEQVQRLRAGNKTRGNHTKATFAMVDANIKPDVSYLIGLDVGGDALAEAVAQAIFKANEKGALAKVAVAGGFRCYTPDVPLVIDGPFLVWFEGEGCELPLAFGHIGPDVWGRPEIDFAAGPKQKA